MCCLPSCLVVIAVWFVQLLEMSIMCDIDFFVYSVGYLSLPNQTLDAHLPHVPFHFVLHDEVLSCLNSELMQYVNQFSDRSEEDVCMM